ncbi:MAG: site-specific integrase [Thermoplasmata archaeon]|nr:site-specific integrase [Candidatus Sysuiplasma jiujiangense]MBX8643070.1 site-specific integrase [Candidatus Sysuiplasma jiujiangense]
MRIYTTQKKRTVRKKESPKMPANKTTRNRTSNDPLTIEEANSILRTTDNISDYTLILTGLYTGMRISEIASMEEISINGPEGRIHVWDEKKDRYRDIYVPDEVLASLKRYINSLEKRKDPKLFPFSHKTIERKIQTWTARVLGKKKSWHAIRHTYISLSRELGIPMEIVIQNTGDSASTILRYYSKPSPEFIRNTVNGKKIYEVR